MPIRIVLSAACAEPAAVNMAAAPSDSHCSLVDRGLMRFLPSTDGVRSIGKWPNPKVVSDVSPQPVETLWLDNQENMINPPNRIKVKLGTSRRIVSAEKTMLPKSVRNKRVASGKRVINIAPKIDPNTEPSPPIIIIAR